ncbi:MAG: metal-dependent hydrolase [Saprospiraceae bacterium]
MDSLTQIVLGAAVGEVVLGKKIGNRAMFWGAVGGTIPDLDIMANFVTDEISSLAFHRSITHSAFFAVLTPIALGWLVHRLYNAQEKTWSELWKGWGLTALAFFLVTAIGVVVLPIPDQDIWKISGTVSAAIMVVPLLVMFREKLRASPHDWKNPRWQSWAWLFFWAILTHPLLDCCTTYGTQLFQPFSDYRIGLNNISVADPLYTIPFLLFVIAASFYTRHRPIRQRLNQIGIIVSSIYMVFTFYNKHRINQIFEQSLATQGIEYQRYMTTPSIFNNVLWNGVAETEDAFYLGMYSFFDSSSEIPAFVRQPKDMTLIQNYEGQRPVEVLQWFTNGYYNTRRLPDGRIQFNDLRFGRVGTADDEESDFVFNFIFADEDGKLEFKEGGGGPPEDGEAEKIFADLWARIKGI